MNKTLRIKTTIIAIFALLAMLVSAMLVVMPFAKADDGQTVALVYADDTHTVVTGIDEEALASVTEFTVTIPASVTEIGEYAFAPAREKLVGVAFEKGSALKTIGDFAFGATGITEISLPNGLETIGASAFAETKLTSVTIPASVTAVGQRAFGNIDNKLVVTVLNASAAFGEQAFDAGSYVIANNRAAYDALVANSTLTGYTDELTYTVNVEYNLMGYVVATETRLYGKDYGFELVDGEWTETGKATLGTAAIADMTWYAKADGTGDALDVAAVSAMLKSEDLTGDTITLYATQKGSGKMFFARNNLVFSDRHYKSNEDINSLLARPASDPISSTASVTITGYTDPDGAAAEALPEDIYNAGHYVLNINDGGDYTLELDIARREINLGEMSVLAWRLISVGGTPNVAELLNSTGITLYIYERNDGTGVYPSRRLLNDAEKGALDVSDSYIQKTVRNSVVRYRDADTNITIGVNGGLLDTAYEITVDNDKISGAKEVGAYTAAVTVNAFDNYAFVRNAIPTDNVARGIRITVAEDGRSAYVEKDWYIVTEGNRLVGADGEDYDIADRVYGDNDAVVVPRLLYDVESNDYGSASDPVSLTLMYRRNAGESNIVIGAETFTRLEMYSYINNAMPAGYYQLRVRAQEVVAVEYDDDNNPAYISHAGFDDVISFTVSKREMNGLMTERVDYALKNKTFTYEYDGTAHLYNAEAATIVADVIASYDATISRYNTVWYDRAYDYLFGDFEISFNLARLLSDVYYTASTLPASVSPINPDKYTIYYKVSAPNYIDSIDGEGVVRTDCKFDVINVMAIDLPVLLDRQYTGKTVTADIADTAIYTVTKNAGGINVGDYEVELTLVAPEFYMWKGQTVDDKTVTQTVTFSIVSASNHWEVEPGVTFWVEGSYDAEVNAIFGSAALGEMIIEITDLNGNVVYSTASGVNKLARIGAGAYLLSATVEATDNYDALSYAIFINVFERQLLPWWGILLVVIGALAIAALIILILWKKGVFQILTDKIVLSIRTKATIDATIAAVRAGKVAAAAQASLAEAEARDKAKERAEARKAAQEAERAKSTGEKAAELEAKAQSEAERAEKIKAKAEEMQARAAAMKTTAEEEAAAAAKAKASKKKSTKKAD